MTIIDFPGTTKAEVSVEDVMVRAESVVGLVINWTAVEMANLHVDPLAVRAKFVVDSTGHPAEVVQVLQRKNRVSLKAPRKKYFLVVV
jgi:thiamine thiazole synthase